MGGLTIRAHPPAPTIPPAPVGCSAWLAGFSPMKLRVRLCLLHRGLTGLAVKRDDFSRCLAGQTPGVAIADPTDQVDRAQSSGFHVW